VAQGAKYYDDKYAASSSYAQSYRDSHYLPQWVQVEFWLRPFKDKTLLDLGCGPGQFAEMLDDLEYPNYTGLDFSPVAIKKAKTRSSYPFHTADLYKEDLASKSADVAICLEVLEHLDRDQEVVEKLPEGTFCIFSVPDFDDPGHVRWFRSEYQVRKRYYKYVAIEDIQFICGIWLFKGVRSDFKPNLIQSILKTREPISWSSFSLRMRHRVLHFFKIKHT
jgi:SAM-dependent methyltransferase